MINEMLARNSNYALYFATIVYLLAFLAYVVEWVFGSKSKFVVAAVPESAEVRAEAMAGVGGGIPPQVARPDSLLPDPEAPDPTVDNGNLRAAIFGIVRCR